MTKGSFIRNVVVGIAVSACASGTKQEAASLVVAVERFHQAENAARPSAADFLATVPCSAKDVCAAKEACVKAAGETAQALRLKADVERGLADLEAKKVAPDDESAKGLPGKLDEASRMLTAGHADMPACDARVLDLKRTYGF